MPESRGRHCYGEGCHAECDHAECDANGDAKVDASAEGKTHNGQPYKSRTQIKTWIDVEVKDVTPTPNAGESVRFVFNTTDTGLF